MDDDAKEAAFAKEWGFREQTRSVSERMHYQFWFDAGWRAARATPVPQNSGEGE